MSSPAQSLRQRAATAATAAERLAMSTAGTAVDDPVVVAYLRRFLAAAAQVEDYTQYAIARVEADPNYLGPLRLQFDPGYSVNRQP